MSHALMLLLVIIMMTMMATVVYAQVPGYQMDYGKNCTTQDELKYCSDDLVCDPFTLKCTWCKNDTQCTAKHATYRCMPVTSKLFPSNDTICQHKNLFPDFDIWDIMNTISNFIGGTLSGAGGIGGGGVFVPLLHILGQFPPTLAIPLSKAMIFGGALLNVIVMFFQTHPEDPNRPLIDYDVALVFEPCTLIGTTVGVICNITFPDWLTVLLLFVILGITTVRTFQKGVQVAKKELKRASPEKQEQASIQEAPAEHTTSETETTGLIEKPKDEASERLLRKIRRNERKTPVGKFLVLLGCWILIIILSLLRGGHGAGSIVGIVPCSAWYWVLFSISFPIIIGISMITGIYLMFKHREKVKVGYEFKKGDIVWTWKTITLYPFACFVAGILAALLGIGGGMVKGPLLLELGVDGNVASATSSFMVFFTSSITSAQYIILGRMPWDYGLWFCGLGFLSSLLGQIIIGYPARRYKITFIIIFSVTIVIALATLLMGGSGVYNVVMDIKQGVYLGFRPAC